MVLIILKKHVFLTCVWTQDNFFIPPTQFEEKFYALDKKDKMVITKP